MMPVSLIASSFNNIPYFRTTATVLNSRLKAIEKDIICISLRKRTTYLNDDDI